VEKRIAGAYAVAGIAWVLLSDTVLRMTVSNVAAQAQIQTIKGWVFVLLSTSLVYVLARHALRKREASIVDLQAGQDALRDANERYRALVEQSVVGTYVLDGELITYASPRMEEIFGYPPGGLDGLSVNDLVVPGDYEKVLRRIERRFSDGGKLARYQFRCRRRDGRAIVLEVDGALARIGGKELIVGVAHDVTERSMVETRERDHLRRIEEAVMGTITVVSRMVELRDPYTAGHEARVAEVAVAIGQEMRLPADRLEGLSLAASIHDLGKIAIPSDILAKPGKLSEIEYEYVKHHAQAGYELLQGLSFPWPLADMVRQHHERIDGSGYPLGLKGAEILLEARILAVADVVEAMASHRPYRASRGVEVALEEIERNAGVLYDAEVAATCLRLFREKGYRLPA
jgi:PAS domain S-box-containing protein